MSISPNAIKGSFKVRYPRQHADNPDLIVQLLDTKGQTLQVPILIETTNRDWIDIKIQNQHSGIYFLKIEDGKTFIMKKIILQ